ncbi:hypothetical protein B0H19DRAFT_1273494 [Mycena capillaripes]|nr:hypothetical protein B0H19DRAFT_1273494 [Mycena capillaripes]
MNSSLAAAFSLISESQVEELGAYTRSNADWGVKLSGDGTGMSLWEAKYWCFGTPQEKTLRTQYPDLSEDERKMAWIDDNHEKIREGTTAFIAFHADKFQPSASVDPSGSFFFAQRHVLSPVGLLGPPPIIGFNHEGFAYIVTSPSHVAALHAFRDWAPALEYLQAHCDSLHPAVQAGAAPDPVAFPTLRDAVEASGGWRKRQRYIAEHYDLKEVLDSEGNVVSSEQGTDILEEGPPRL